MILKRKGLLRCGGGWVGHDWRPTVTPTGEGRETALLGISCARCGDHYGRPWPGRSDGTYLGPVGWPK